MLPNVTTQPQVVLAKGSSVSMYSLLPRLWPMS